MHLNQHGLTRRLHRTSILEERLRLARDLHDGILQSLAGIGLKIQAADHLLASDPEKARHELAEIQSLLLSEQRDIRSLVKELRPYGFRSAEDVTSLLDKLDGLKKTISDHWKMDVSLKMARNSNNNMDDRLKREVYFLMREALVNAARHARATNVSAELDMEGPCIHIRVMDNGHGFPYHGRYDHTALCASRMGPRSIRERLAALGGSLTLDSRDTGTTLEMTIPLDSPKGSPHHAHSPGFGR
jgi:signal transduction histidine kinase